MYLITLLLVRVYKYIQYYSLVVLYTVKTYLHCIWMRNLAACYNKSKFGFVPVLGLKTVKQTISLYHWKLNQPNSKLIYLNSDKCLCKNTHLFQVNKASHWQYHFKPQLPIIFTTPTKHMKTVCPRAWPFLLNVHWTVNKY